MVAIGSGSSARRRTCRYVPVSRGETAATLSSRASGSRARAVTASARTNPSSLALLGTDADERAITAHHGFHGSENRSPGSSSAPTPPCSTSRGDGLGNGTRQPPEVVHKEKIVRARWLDL